MKKLLDYGPFSFLLSDSTNELDIVHRIQDGSVQTLTVTLEEQEEFRTGLRLAFARAAREQRRNTDVGVSHPSR